MYSFYSLYFDIDVFPEFGDFSGAIHSIATIDKFTTTT